MRLISVMTPCFNEEGSVREMYDAVKAIFATPRSCWRAIFRIRWSSFPNSCAAASLLVALPLAYGHFVRERRSRLA